MNARIFGPAAVVLATVAPALAGKETPEEIRRAVTDLGNKSFAAREKATRLLWRAGPDAEPVLRAALASDNPEVVRRAKQLLDKFEWGIFPDTPPEVVEQIGRFRSGDRNVRLQVAARLMELGRPGYNALKRLAEKEENPSDRQALFARMAAEAQRALPALLAAGDVAGVEDLLERCLLAGTDEAFTHYAAFCAQHGKLAEALARWGREWERSQSATAASTLVHLLRARGDFARARALAEQVKNEALVEQLLWEEGNWKGLSARLKKSDAESRDALGLGTRAAIHRLAGDGAAFDAAIARLRQLVETADRFEQRAAAEALLLNGRHEDALRLLLDKKVAPALAFDLLFTRMRYKEAFELAAAAQPAEAEERFQLELRRARALHVLGQKDEALAAFARLGAGLKDQGGLGAARDLVKVMVRLGLHDAATDQAGRFVGGFLPRRSDDRVEAEVIETLFEEDAEIATLWWRFLDGDGVAAMLTTRRVLDGPPPPELDDWAAKLARQRLPQSANQSGAAGRAGVAPAHAAAVALLRAGREQKAAEYFELALTQSSSPDVPLRYADHLAKRGRHKEAAAWYERASKRAPNSALLVFLRGAALRRAGDEKEGTRLVELAHRMPLGSEYERGRLALELEKRGFTEDAKRECEHVLTFGWYRHWHVGNVLNAAARQAVREKYYARAIALYQKSIAGGMRFGTGYVEHASYLAVPQTLPQLRARALLAEGKYDEAVREVRSSLEILPGNLELVIHAVPALDKAGRNKESDELYAAVRDRYAALCRDYPASAYGHNSLAWLAANCGRELDRALEHARTAVRLDPAADAYLDTLAEVHFRRGDQARAVELMQQCLQLKPERAYYVKQMARFRKGDRAAPLPREED